MPVGLDLLHPSRIQHPRCFHAWHPALRPRDRLRICTNLLVIFFWSCSSITQGLPKVSSHCPGQTQKGHGQVMALPSCHFWGVKVSPGGKQPSSSQHCWALSIPDLARLKLAISL